MSCLLQFFMMGRLLSRERDDEENEQNKDPYRE